VDIHGRESAHIAESHTVDRTLADIVKDAAASLREIVRDEVRLARVELTESLRKLRNASAALSGGALLGIFALAFFLLAAMFALEMVMPPWLAATLLAVLLSICAAIGISVGRSRLKELQLPRKTIQTVKEHFEWIKEQPRS
jgi:hypothetical protein